MTDKQLLELAAKAAGMRCIEYTNDYDGMMGLMQCDEHGRHTYTWNPLADDGDALRLCVKLGLDVASFLGSKVTRCWVLWFANDGIKEPHGSDPYAATRRAITRAAAEIGKAME